MRKTLDEKLAVMTQGRTVGPFILADAKDADMAFGIAAPGVTRQADGTLRRRTLDEYRQIIRENIAQGLVDIVLMSASTNEQLTLREKLFEGSAITPAVRANDTSDIWLARGATYASQPAKPFRSASLEHALCGKEGCTPDERRAGADLGLYSLTFNNDIQLDHPTLLAYNAFRTEAEAKGFRHFLEIFNPNAPKLPPEDLPAFLNDMIARTLAGISGKQKPVFLKIPYHGPKAMEELASYDSTLVVGILGGSAGTTYDAFHQLHEARKYGARAALYGRMINQAEDQRLFIEHLRRLADGEQEPTDAVRSYHDGLARRKLIPHRTLEDDLQSTDRMANYGGGSAAAKPGRRPASREGKPVDFAQMSNAERVQWNLKHWSSVLD